MRLYTHTDLDGVFSAVLLSEVEEIDEVLFVDPASVQAGRILFTKFDIIADLPYDKRCGMWFDHHESNKPKEGIKFEGLWKIAPSCAQVIFDWAENPYLDKYRQALEEVNKIDGGNVPLEEALRPTDWFLLSNTLESNAQKKEDDEYRRHVIELIRKNPEIKSILSDGQVEARANKVAQNLELYKKLLVENTRMIGKVAFSDLRNIKDLPKGNNYLIYAIFPDAVSSVRIMPYEEGSDFVKISAGHNVYCPESQFNIGTAMKELGGGGHRTVGGAKVKKEDAERLALELVDQINKHL